MVKFILLFLCFAGAAFGQPGKKLSQAEKDFETFWTCFKDHYAFFTLKSVNWDSTYARYRPLVTRRTSEKELLAILQHMVEPLKDGHITISKGDKVLFKVKKPSRFAQEFKGRESAFWQTVDSTLMQNGFPKPAGVGPVFKGQHLYDVSLTKDISYIRITRCFATVESLFDDKKELEDTRVMLHLFDSLLALAANTQALMLDLRANGGGHGGAELAARLTETTLLTHYKALRQQGSYDAFSEPEPNYIAPHNGIRFTKPVMLFINDKTASSAEDLTIALYRQEQVSTIGTHTSGMLSDMYSGELSNGLSFTLSNQVYYDADMNMLEDKGIIPAYEVENTAADIERKKDPVILKALELLRSQK